jgi:FAD dependent oxidoreductase TIGR03364
MSMHDHYDVAVVGRGIVGLAHALAAARTGARVVVIDRHARATGATIRNFGFITVTGQERHQMWPLALRTRDIWARVAPRAGIAVLQTGLVLPVRRAQSVAVIEAFLATEMGEGCALVTDARLRALEPEVPFPPSHGALVSGHELRVEPREAAPLLARWLEAAMGVAFAPPACVLAADTGRIETPQGTIRAETIFLCPGDDLTGLYPETLAHYGVSRCKLQMLRLAPPGWRSTRPIMSDLGLARYEGYADLPEAEPLKALLRAEQPDALDAGVHLIVVQSADGSLVVGDSHEYGDAPDPFQHEAIDRIILDEFQAVCGPAARASEHWVGTYAWSARQNWVHHEVAPRVHLSLASCGAGMSTSFAFAEDVVAGALNTTLKEIA